MNRTQAVHSLRTRAVPKTVLIVEDNDLNMKLFHDLLEAHGYDTLQTKDGMEALKLARQHHPDLILMDIQLPEVSGLEVTKWIKEDDDLKAIPTIAVTAFAMKGDEDFLTKPVSDIALFARVRSLVRLKRMTDEWRLREETYGRLADLADGEAKASEDTRPARIIVFEDRPLSAQRVLDTLSAHTV